MNSSDENQAGVSIPRKQRGMKRKEKHDDCEQSFECRKSSGDAICLKMLRECEPAISADEWNVPVKIFRNVGRRVVGTVDQEQRPNFTKELETLQPVDTSCCNVGEASSCVDETHSFCDDEDMAKIQDTVHISDVHTVLGDPSGIKQDISVDEHSGMKEEIWMAKHSGMNEQISVTEHSEMKEEILVTEHRCVTVKEEILVDEHNVTKEEILVAEHCGMKEEISVTEHSGMKEEILVAEHSGMNEEISVTEHSGTNEEISVTEHSGTNEEISVTEHSGMNEEISVTEHSGMNEEISVAEHSGMIEEIVDSAVNRKGRPFSKIQYKVRKEQYNSGKEYISRRGKLVEQRKLGKGCVENCKKRCLDRISETTRQDIFAEFWNLGGAEKQWRYIIANVTEEPTACQKRNPTRLRSVSRVYSFTIDDVRENVCQTFFLSTLAISDKKVTTAMKKKREHGVWTKDNRGKHHNRPGSFGDENVIISDHIQSFPHVSAHVCRLNKQRNYLDASLSIEQMYRLYEEKRKEAGCETIGSLSRYKQIFYTKFNLGFNKPKSHFCETCKPFEKQIPHSLETTQFYQTHLEEANSVRDYKNDLKRSAKTSSEFCAATFDFEILHTPKSNEGILNYKRKLNNYNLSIFDFKSGVCYNYLWNEAIAKRGTIEIASAVFSFIQTVAAKGITKMTLFSDSCSGHTQNEHFLAMLWFAVQNTDIDLVEHVYFVKGHSENESDSIRASIEKASKHMCIYNTAQWATVIQGAKRSLPTFKVNEMTKADFWNFKDVSQRFTNTKHNTDHQRVDWSKIRKYSLRKEEPNVVKIFYELNGTPVRMNLTQKLGIKSIDFDVNFELTPAYTTAIPITVDKHNDLMDLCHSGVIPQAHHQFYDSLATANDVTSDDDDDKEMEDRV